jgi:hypothetical protein
VSGMTTPSEPVHEPHPATVPADVVPTPAELPASERRPRRPAPKMLLALAGAFLAGALTTACVGVVAVAAVSHHDWDERRPGFDRRDHRDGDERRRPERGDERRPGRDGRDGRERREGVPRPPTLPVPSRSAAPSPTVSPSAS